MNKNDLIKPHGSEELKPLLLSGEEKNEEIERSKSMKRVEITNREAGDLIMLGIGGFTPLQGFMGHDDWKGVVNEMKMTDGIFWPIPITLSVSEEEASEINEGDEIALYSNESDEIRATMRVEGKYSIDKNLECTEVFKTNDENYKAVVTAMREQQKRY